MRGPEDFRHQQKASVFVALLMFNMALILLQLWLFVSVLENLVAGKVTAAIPAAAVSIVCLAVNVWMLLGLYRMDKNS